MAARTALAARKMESSKRIAKLWTQKENETDEDAHSRTYGNLSLIDMPVEWEYQLQLTQHCGIDPHPTPTYSSLITDLISVSIVYP